MEELYARIVQWVLAALNKALVPNPIARHTRTVLVVDVPGLALPTAQDQRLQVFCANLQQERLYDAIDNLTFRLPKVTAAHPLLPL